MGPCPRWPAKPGALCNGAPFKDWVLPAAMEHVRRKLAGAEDGNRQMVDILTVVLPDGLPAVEFVRTGADDFAYFSAQLRPTGSRIASALALLRLSFL
jgi:hypothetical protein